LIICCWSYCIDEALHEGMSQLGEKGGWRKEEIDELE